MDQKVRLDRRVESPGEERWGGWELWKHSGARVEGVNQRLDTQKEPWSCWVCGYCALPMRETSLGSKRSSQRGSTSTTRYDNEDSVSFGGNDTFCLKSVLFFPPSQDTFFWTAVMCASWSGQRSAVRLLLQHGAAWVGVVDTKGRDAKDLALEGITNKHGWNPKVISQVKTGC